MAKDNKFNLDGFQQNPDGSYSKKKTILHPIEKIKTVPLNLSSNKSTLEIIDDIVEQVKGSNWIVFKWADIHISLNDWYSSEHWTKRNKTKDFWHKFFKDSLPTTKPFFKKYSITLEFNSRLDVSNTITMIKLCEDTLKKEGVIIDDSKQYCRGVYLIPVDEMKKFSYKITVKNEI